MEFSELFEMIFRENQAEEFLPLSPRFEALDSLLSSAGFNLTALKTPAETIPLHYLDSLTASEYIPENITLLDVGSGGGFPALPLAIARKDLSLTALDSTAKKLTFVERAAATLGLENIKTLCARAEDFSQTDARESFGAAIARAVAPLPMLCELCLPAVAVGGRFIAMKGSEGEGELASAKKAISALGGGKTTLYKKALVTPSGCAERTIIVIEKIRPTDRKYPRRFAQIKKTPL